jgi:uncharacterized membrane protein YjgN (DUF898 family)
MRIEQRNPREISARILLFALMPVTLVLSWSMANPWSSPWQRPVGWLFGIPFGHLLSRFRSGMKLGKVSRYLVFAASPLGLLCIIVVTTFVFGQLGFAVPAKNFTVGFIVGDFAAYFASETLRELSWLRGKPR